MRKVVTKMVSPVWLLCTPFHTARFVFWFGISEIAMLTEVKKKMQTTTHSGTSNWHVL